MDTFFDAIFETDALGNETGTSTGSYYHLQIKPSASFEINTSKSEPFLAVIQAFVLFSRQCVYIFYLRPVLDTNCLLAGIARGLKRYENHPRGEEPLLDHGLCSCFVHEQHTYKQ